MPAVSKKQQRFFGMVRAAQKGEMASPSPEVSQAASSMSKSDVKKFAKTKHKGLPEKKVAKEAKDFSQRDKIMKRAKPLHKHLFKNLHKGDRTGDVNEETKKCKTGYYYCYTDKKCKKIPMGYHVGARGLLAKDEEQEETTEKKNGNGNGANGNGNGNGQSNGGSNGGGVSEAWSAKYKKSIDCNNPKGFSQRAHCGSRSKVKEDYTSVGNAERIKRYDKEKKEFSKKDKRMKFGKFYDKAKEAKERLRPGEVKRWDKEKKKWVSNKD